MLTEKEKSLARLTEGSIRIYSTVFISRMTVTLYIVSLFPFENFWFFPFYIYTYEGKVSRLSLQPTTRNWISGHWVGTWSWCHLHTSVKLFQSQPMTPWTLAAAYEYPAAQSMDTWAAIKKASQECGGDTSSCPGPYPTAACPEYHIG